MNQKEFKLTRRRLTTPRAAAFAGIIFSILFSISLILIRMAIPPDLATNNWLEREAGKVALALGLMPFAGIAFLWFVGVIRDRLGEFEDQFFSTVFFGSSLLFLVMTFTASAITSGMILSYQHAPIQFVESDIYFFGRAVVSQIFNIYSLRMAGVFMISLGTIWLRTGIMPRLMVFLTYLVALLLLFIINFNLWIVIIFPGWVLIISIYILVLNMRHESVGATDGLTIEA